MNKYYQMFQDGNITNSILKINSKSMSFEDHFWHYACLAIYYNQDNNEYLQKKVLSFACDMNYIYNVIIYLDHYNVLPGQYKKYTTAFEHKMKDDKLESMIKSFNSKDKSSRRLGFLSYSLISLIVIPLMFLLVLVFEMDTQKAAIISVCVLLFAQMVVTPYLRTRKQKKQQRKALNMTKEEVQLFNFVHLFDKLINDPQYVYLIRAKTDEDRDLALKAIKTNVSYEDLKKQQKQDAKNMKQK